MTLDGERRWVPGPGAPFLETLDLDRDRIFRDFYRKLDEWAR